MFNNKSGRYNRDRDNDRYNDKGNGRFNSRRRFGPRDDDFDNNIFYGKLSLPANVSDRVREEVTFTLASTRFNKISYQISAMRKDLGMGDDKDERLITVGYIKNFNLAKKSFQVVIFNNSRDAIGMFKNIVIAPEFTTYKDGLGAITKLIIRDTGDNELTPRRSRKYNRDDDAEDVDDSVGEEAYGDSEPIEQEPSEDCPLTPEEIEGGVTIQDIV